MPTFARNTPLRADPVRYKSLMARLGLHPRRPNAPHIGSCVFQLSRYSLHTTTSRRQLVQRMSSHIHSSRGPRCSMRNAHPCKHSSSQLLPRLDIFVIGVLHLEVSLAETRCGFALRRCDSICSPDQLRLSDAGSRRPLRPMNSFWWPSGLELNVDSRYSLHYSKAIHLLDATSLISLPRERSLEACSAMSLGIQTCLRCHCKSIRPAHP